MLLLYKVICLDYNLLWRADHLHTLILLLLVEPLHLHDWVVCHPESRRMLLLLSIGSHDCVRLVRVQVAQDQLSEL